eukprot:15334516-Ditylum_brightwellii.AAC.2
MTAFGDGKQERAREAREADREHYHSDMMMMIHGKSLANPNLKAESPITSPVKSPSASHEPNVPVTPVLTFIMQPGVVVRQVRPQLAQAFHNESSESAETLIAKETIAHDTADMFNTPPNPDFFHGITGKERNKLRDLIELKNQRKKAEGD